MAVSGLGGGIPQFARPILAATAGETRRHDSAAAAAARLEMSASEADATRNAIREKGLYAWAQEEKWKKLREKIEAEVREQFGADTSKMSPEQAASLEARIHEEIQRRIEAALKTAAEQEHRKAAATGQPPKPMIIDISV